MKHLRIIPLIALIWALLALLLTISDYLALHDIWQDYLSPHIVEYLGIKFSKEIPGWTETRGEWRMVAVSLFSRFFFFIFIIFVLLNYNKKIKHS
jgi:hypothetical protein